MADQLSKDVSRWVKAYGTMLYRYAWVHVSNKDTAMDLVQETFLSAIKNIETLLSPYKEKNWLFTILKNKITDFYRSRAASPVQSFANEFSMDDWFTADGRWKEHVPSWSSPPEQNLLNQEFMNILQQCISVLPDLHKKVFSLRDIVELAAEDICSVLNISSANLWTITSRARQKLRVCLNENWFGGEK
jgi:RNA polymerase sigma-70 factor (ECF subfamily)